MLLHWIGGILYGLGQEPGGLGGKFVGAFGWIPSSHPAGTLVAYNRQLGGFTDVSVLVVCDQVCEYAQLGEPHLPSAAFLIL